MQCIVYYVTEFKFVYEKLWMLDFSKELNQTERFSNPLGKTCLNLCVGLVNFDKKNYLSIEQNCLILNIGYFI